jgi:hypothetical protein
MEVIIRMSRDSPNPIWRFLNNPGREAMFMIVRLGG